MTPIEEKKDEKVCKSSVTSIGTKTEEILIARLSALLIINSFEYSG
jgi:hypothetical protein